MKSNKFRWVGTPTDKKIKFQTMKSIILWAISIFSIQFANAQFFTLPIYLSDASGNADTVYISGDLTASTLLDANFGEVNITGVPYDSVFEARLTSDAFSAARIETKKQALYYECVGLAGYLQANTVMLRCKNWPVTVKWDRIIVDSTLLCISLSGISKDLSYFGGDGPQYNLTDRDSVQYSVSQLFTPYNISTKDGQSSPVYVIAIGILGDGTIGVSDITKEYITLWPNPATNRLSFNFSESKEFRVRLLDINGCLITDKKNPHDNSMDVSSFAPGIYFAEIQTDIAVTRLKWMKL